MENDPNNNTINNNKPHSHAKTSVANFLIVYNRSTIPPRTLEVWTKLLARESFDVALWDVFICHAGQQYCQAFRIHQTLKKDCIKTFLDVESVRPGQQLTQELFDSYLTRTVHSVIVLLSEQFFSSEYTLAELRVRTWEFCFVH